jgi:hypothetical protein
MPETSFRSRRVVQIENDAVRVSITVEGGHIAEILDKHTGINPLWVPEWPSIEPTTYNPQRHPEYGNGAESQLLSGLMGHNLCLDMFGPPSEEELAAGMTAHGEANVVRWEISSSDTALTARCTLPVAQLRFERRLRLAGHRLLFAETVENLSALDRPIAWTQHVTLGSPFLERGSTRFHLPATKSRTTGNAVDFDWPYLPNKDGRSQDLRLYNPADSSGGYTAHLLNPAKENAWFLAYAPAQKLLFGYIWQRSDFPWLGIWEENHSRKHTPWNGREMTRGMEFGVSPFPETRREMIDRHALFGTPCYRWLSAKSKITVNYCAGVAEAPDIPESPEEFEALVGNECRVSEVRG